jgi:hypothetical protein
MKRVKEAPITSRKTMAGKTLADAGISKTRSSSNSRGYPV